MYSEHPVAPEEHIIVALCRQAGIVGKVTLRPYIRLTASEPDFGRFGDRQVAIMSTGRNARFAIANKEWSIEGFQQVVDSLRKEVSLVQLGTAADPALRGVADLRGRINLRQAAAVLKNSALFVGQVGLLMHLARAVGCRSVIVYGGYEAPWHSGYPCNCNLFTALPCSPCYQPSRCDFNRACMEAITADTVAQAVKTMLLKPSQSLESQEAIVTHCESDC
jgi:ADP-heptose:LPS heptosyltransferase